MNHLDRVQQLALALPEAERVDVEQWGDHPTFRVRGKTFIFADGAGSSISVKLPPEEAAALVATRADAQPSGYGLGRHGWVVVQLPADDSDSAWAEVAEWVQTSYRLVAPKRLARMVP